jgi:hypothetical protein
VRGVTLYILFVDWIDESRGQPITKVLKGLLVAMLNPRLKFLAPKGSRSG